MIKHIGDIVRLSLKKKGHTIEWFSNEMNMSYRGAYDLLKRDMWKVHQMLQAEKILGIKLIDEINSLPIAEEVNEAPGTYANKSKSIIVQIALDLGDAAHRKIFNEYTMQTGHQLSLVKQ